MLTELTGRGGCVGKVDRSLDGAVETEEDVSSTFPQGAAHSQSMWRRQLPAQAGDRGEGVF